MESKILGAEERSVKLEYDLFLRRPRSGDRPAAGDPTDRSSLGSARRAGDFAETARLLTIAARRCQEGVLRFRTDGISFDQVLSEERFVPNDTNWIFRTSKSL